jgi:hypothetical protein
MTTHADRPVPIRDAQDRWSRPPRPDWVARVVAEGAHLDLREVVPLDPAELIATACAATGLVDFGDDGWYEPFRALVADLDANSRLTLLGRVMTRQDLLVTLEGRLRIEATYNAHPEIEEEEISAPLVIVGQGRSGTSVLQNMLAAHPDNRTPLHWEAMFPVRFGRSGQPGCSGCGTGWPPSWPRCASSPRWCPPRPSTPSACPSSPRPGSTRSSGSATSTPGS